MKEIQTPLLTVDIIIRYEGVLCSSSVRTLLRDGPCPAGFVDIGESLEEAAIREAKEETSLNITLVEQFHAYSKPDRDPRFHTATMVLIADGKGILRGRDDARKAEVFTENTLPAQIAFDHGQIIADYFKYQRQVFDHIVKNHFLILPMNGFLK